MTSEYPQHPIIGVGGVLIRNDQVLLVKRGQAPAQGLWSFPGGKQEVGESLQQAVLREMWEETGLEVRVGALEAYLDLIERDRSDMVRFHYVILDFRVEYLSGSLRPGDDVTEAAWFSHTDLEAVDVHPDTAALARGLLSVASKP